MLSNVNNCPCGGKYHYVKACDSYVCNKCDDHRGMVSCKNPHCVWTMPSGDNWPMMEDVPEPEAVDVS